MYIDCNDKKQRRSVFEKLKETIGNALDCKSTHITLPICRFEQIEAVMERLEEIVEEQEERIAIMSEGKDEEKIHRLQRELRNCRNELCLKCGLYHRAHEGVCNDCRYRHAGEWSVDIRDGDPG